MAAITDRIRSIRPGEDEDEVEVGVVAALTETVALPGDAEAERTHALPTVALPGDAEAERTHRVLSTDSDRARWASPSTVVVEVPLSDDVELGRTDAGVSEDPTGAVPRTVARSGEEGAQAVGESLTTGGKREAEASVDILVTGGQEEA